MKTLNKKLGKNGGFTLIEMLIVVAIIAILIAISIPMLNNILEDSRHGVDDANYRNAVSLGNVMYLSHTAEFDKLFANRTQGVTYGYYVNENVGQANDRQAELITAGEPDAPGNVTAIPNGYAQVTAKCTEAQDSSGDDTGSYQNATLTVTIAPSEDGTGVDITAEWVDK